MFQEQADKIKEIENLVIENLSEAPISQISFSDILIKEDEGSNGKYIGFEGKVLFKFLLSESKIAMAEFNYRRHYKDSTKKYVTMGVTIHVDGLKLTDRVNFVDGDNDKFYNTQMYVTKVIFDGVEDVIRPIIVSTTRNVL